MSDDELATLRVRERGDIVIANVEGEIDLSNASSLLMDLASAVPTRTFVRPVLGAGHL